MAAGDEPDEEPTPSLSIDVPDRDEEGDRFDNAEWVDRFVLLFCEHFGGASELAVTGHYVTNDGLHIREQTTRIHAFASKETIRAALPVVLALATEFAVETRQESVLLIVNQHARFLSRKRLEGELEVPDEG